MVEYLWPSKTAGVSDTYWDHRNRTPPSVNPGTDIVAPYGSNVYATRSGTVTGMSRTNTGSGGRYLQVSNDNGTRSQYLHLSQHLLNIGDRVTQGQIVAISGASGFGSDWGYGPHLHKSLMINGSNVDFQLYSSPGSSTAGGGDYTPIPIEEEDPLAAWTEADLRRFAYEESGRALFDGFLNSPELKQPTNLRDILRDEMDDSNHKEPATGVNGEIYKALGQNGFLWQEIGKRLDRIIAPAARAGSFQGYRIDGQSQQWAISIPLGFVRKLEGTDRENLVNLGLLKKTYEGDSFGETIVSQGVFDFLIAQVNKTRLANGLEAVVI